MVDSSLFEPSLSFASPGGDHAECHERAPGLRRTLSERSFAIVCCPVKGCCSILSCCCKAIGFWRWRARRFADAWGLREAGSAPPRIPALSAGRAGLDVQELSVGVVACDGHWLRGTLFQPCTSVSSTPGPAVLLRTPYGNSVFGFVGRALASRGFRVLLQDVRGYGLSGGRTSLAAWEKTDGSHSIAWLRAQPWCNGQVTLLGCSYDGFCAWSGLAAAVEAEGVGPVSGVSTVMVLSSSSDLMKKGMFRGGAFAVQLASGWYDIMLRLHEASLSRKSCCGARGLAGVVQLIQSFVSTRRPSWHKVLTSSAEAMPQAVRELNGTAGTQAGKDLVVPLAEAEDPASAFWQNRDHSAVVGQVYSKLGNAAPCISISTGWFDVFMEASIADYCTLHRAWTLEKERRVEAGLEALHVPAPRLTVGPLNHFEGIDMWFGDCVALLDEFSFDAARSGGNDPDFGGRANDGANSTSVWIFFLGLGPEPAEACTRQIPVGELRSSQRREPVDVVMGKGLTDPKSPKSKSNHCAWKRFNVWPPPVVSDCDFDLDMSAKAILQSGLKTGNDGVVNFVFDPMKPTPCRGGAIFDFNAAGRRDISLDCLRPDVVVLDSPVISAALEIAGTPKVFVFVKISACDSADIFCRLLDCAPDGRVLPVCDGILRMTFQAGESTEEMDTERLPGRWAALDLQPTAAHFAPNHKLRLLFAGGAFPRYDANTGYAADGFRGTRRRPQHIQLSNFAPASAAGPAEMCSAVMQPRLHRRASTGVGASAILAPERSILRLPVLGGVAAAAVAFFQPER